MSAAVSGERLRALLPHAGDMRLLERVEAWDATEIRCTTLTHRDARNPLRNATGLAAVHLIEYAAQAAALHGALLAGGRPQPGMLAAVREAHLLVARLDSLEAPLEVLAVRRIARPDGLLYDYAVRCADALLSRGRIAIALV